MVHGSWSVVHGCEHDEGLWKQLAVACQDLWSSSGFIRISGRVLQCASCQWYWLTEGELVVIFGFLGCSDQRPF